MALLDSPSRPASLGRSWHFLINYCIIHGSLAAIIGVNIDYSFVLTNFQLHFGITPCSDLGNSLGLSPRFSLCPPSFLSQGATRLELHAP